MRSVPAAHIDDAGIPFNRFLIQIDVPDDIWAQREEVSPDKLSPTWAAIPAMQTLRESLPRCYDNSNTTGSSAAINWRCHELVGVV